MYDNRIGRSLNQPFPHLSELCDRLASQAIGTYKLDASVPHWHVTSLYLEEIYAEVAVPDTFWLDVRLFHTGSLIRSGDSIVKVLSAYHE